MLRKFYVSILCLFFTFITLAQEKIWEIEGNNKRGKAIINLPNNAGYLVASQDQILNFNPINSKNHWGPVHYQGFSITAICNATNGNVFIVGNENNKACVKKINYSDGDIINSQLDTSASSIFSAIYALPGGNAIACGYLYDLGVTQALIANINNTGVFTLESLPNFIGLNSQITAISANKQGNKVFVAGKFSNGSDSIFVWEKGTSNYTVLPSKGTDATVNFLAVAADNSIFLGYQHTTNFLDYSQELVKLNANLSIEKSIPAFGKINAAIALQDASLVYTGSVGTQLVIAKLDKNLTPIWAKNVGFAPYNVGFSIDSTANNYIVAGETGASASDVDVLIVRVTDTKTIVKNQIVGQVKGGLTCGAATAIPLSGFPVQGKINGKTHFGLTDNQGFYTITTDTIGPIEIQAVNILGSGYQNCIPVIDTIWANGVIRTAPTFYVQDTSTTPHLRVDLSTDILVPNDTSTYSLYVKNTRSVAINNVYAKVNFDLALKPIAPILNDSIFIGTLAGNEEKRIPIKRKFEPSTPIFPNKTYCTSANIFPNNSNWNGLRLKVTAECDISNQRIKVTVKNNGTGALVSKTGGVIVDDVILKTIFINNLPSGVDTILFVNIGQVFNTFIAVMDQGINNPYGNFASDRGENCNNTNVFLPQTSYADHDDDPTYAIECLKVTTTTTLAKSETVIFPLGGIKSIGKEDTLTQYNTTLEYHDIIQNTGSDTTKNIVLEHFFSINLTLDKIELGASSHPFTARVDSNKLILTVPNIALVPSGLDSRKSIAFFNFRLKLPQKDNDSETFTTRTGVRFGYDSTTTVIDTVKRIIKKLKISVLSINTLHKDLPSIKVAPNPMQSSAQISVAEEWIGAIFNVFDLQGRLVLQIPITQTHFQIDADHLSHAGLFFCKIELKGRVVANGKMVVQ